MSKGSTTKFDRALRAGLVFVLAIFAASTANALIVTQWSVSVDSTFDPNSIVDSNGDTPGDVGTPMPLGTALAKAVADVIGNESSSSTDYEALANAAKDILRYA